VRRGVQRRSGPTQDVLDEGALLVTQVPDDGEEILHDGAEVPPAEVERLFADDDPYVPAVLRIPPTLDVTCCFETSQQCRRGLARHIEKVCEVTGVDRGLATFCIQERDQRSQVRDRNARLACGVRHAPVVGERERTDQMHGC
jgi:hypothetical protein